MRSDLAARARCAVRDIAAELAPGGPGLELAHDGSYATGYAGFALLHAYRAADARAPEHAAHAGALLDRAAERMPARSELFTGFAGIGWTARHVGHLLRDAPSASLTADIDDVLIRRVRATPWSGDYDLMRGLVGLGCYALDHDDPVTATTLLTSVIDRLDELARPRDGGVTWWTPPHRLPGPLTARYPAGCFNLGLAHGVPAVLALLARACARGIDADRARRLLDDGVTWLLAQRRSDRGSVWGYVAGDGARARLAWCYGDLGIAAALLCAARCTHNTAWADVAIDVAVQSTALPMDDVGVRDAGLCHGSAGLALLYTHLFHASGHGDLADAARRWFQRTLELRRTGRGIAGFEVWSAQRPNGTVAARDAGLLEGAAGIGLALLAGASFIEPAWNRPLSIAA